MALTVIQSGSTLQLLDTDGTLQTLALPDGVTLRTDVAPRWTVFGRYAILTNTPSQPLTIDPLGKVRLLTPRPPRLAPVLSGVSGGTLTGTYRAEMTFVVLDPLGNIISESDYSPISSQVTITNQSLQAANLDISPDEITGRRLYRTTTQGAVFFQWIDLDGNILTSVQDDLPDAGLSLTASPILGTPPRLTTIAEFRGRLWGVSDIDIDNVRYTESGVQYSWPADNFVPIPAVGSDSFGVVALIPRREALGCGRRNLLAQVTGSAAEDANGNIDLDVVILSRNCGVESQESVVVYRDTAFWLWKDGVYQWDSGGFRNISDPKVKSWFTTDNYFNRDMYSSAFGVFDPIRLKYRLYLASAGSVRIDSWVEYDVDNNTWWGPHKTDAFSPTTAFVFVDQDDKPQAVVGSNTQFVWEEQITPTDDVSTPIDVDFDTTFIECDTPDLEKYLGEVSVIGKAQPIGSMTVTPRVGYLDASQQAPITYDMTKGRQRLRRLGHGKMFQLNFKHKVADEAVELYGFQLPYHIAGRR